jgi:pimeloyl-ACP methyl ester carboxylesterase
MPDNWNGRLIVGCRGYEGPEMQEMSDTHVMHIAAVAYAGTTGTSSRYAFAWSTYGEGGWCVQAGMIRTHQLTEYVVENYDVPGPVFLMAFSMGGGIGCLLGEKYPDLYDGVLDVCGVKDMASLWMPGTPRAEDMEIECGGTPETKPQAYEKRSPTYHADITIPVISIIGELDSNVPVFQFDMYYDAVEEAGCLDYYRSYTIKGAGHVDVKIQMAISTYFLKLKDWVVSGIVPTPTPPPIP